MDDIVNKINKNFLSIKDFNREFFDSLHFLTKQIICGKTLVLKNKIIANCFFEPSTRTRLSFETAIHHLGAKIIGFYDINNIKKESFLDSIRMLNNYSDAIIIRHFISQTPHIAANISSVPIINAGDGMNEHPTQTVSDLFTIKEKFGTIDNIKIAMVGDLKYSRTVHSLSYALMNYTNISIYYVAPKCLQITDTIKDELNKLNINFICLEKIEEILGIIDVLYMTRLQKERYPINSNYKFQYLINADILNKYARKEMIVMHPLPRSKELCVSVDETKYCWYFKQAEHGVNIRKAILYTLLS